MRLTCPNCDAQYELPEGAIPAAGREVQCSNCGTAWFQAHADSVTPQPQPQSDGDPTADGSAPEPAPAPQRRLDPAVVDILRTEAERERGARAAETAGGPSPAPETRPDPTAVQRPEARPEKRGVSAPARPRQSTDAGAAPHPPRSDTPAPGSDPFPRIEDGAPLRSPSDAARASLAPGGTGPSPAGRGRFRAGSWFGVAGCAVALGVYLLAGDIAGLMPHAEAPLARYVEIIDAGRTWLADQVEALRARF